jgi:hypothetical protein
MEVQNGRYTFTFVNKSCTHINYRFCCFNFALGNNQIQ